jgi:hypothetical protein
MEGLSSDIYVPSTTIGSHAANPMPHESNGTP